MERGYAEGLRVLLVIHGVLYNMVLMGEVWRTATGQSFAVGRRDICTNNMVIMIMYAPLETYPVEATWSEAGAS